MERTDLFELLGELKLYGMRMAYDEVMTTGIKGQHEPPQIVGELLKAEIAEKQARSIKYQLTIAKLPLAKDIADFDFTGTPVNEGLVRDLASGDFLAAQRNAVLIGGTGTGKSHLAIAIARACIRGGARGRFYNVVDLVTVQENLAYFLRGWRAIELWITVKCHCITQRSRRIVMEERRRVPVAGELQRVLDDQGRREVDALGRDAAAALG